jgi:hypothetical protein
MVILEVVVVVVVVVGEVRRRKGILVCSGPIRKRGGSREVGNVFE